MFSSHLIGVLFCPYCLYRAVFLFLCFSFFCFYRKGNSLVGSHTSLSSRSDATDRSVVAFPNAGNGMDVGMWNVENHAQHIIPTSAVIDRDGASDGTSVGTTAPANHPVPNGDFRLSGVPAPVNWLAPNGDSKPLGTPTPVNWRAPNGDHIPSGVTAPVNWLAPNGDHIPSGATAPVNWLASNGDYIPSGASAPVNWPVRNGELKPTGAAMHVPVAGVPKPVPTTVSSSSAILMASASPAFVLHESSSGSAQGISTSLGLPPQNGDYSTSQNHSEYKSSKSVPRPSPTSSSFYPDSSYTSSATSAALWSQNMPLSAAPTSVVPTYVAPIGMPPNGIVPNAVAPAAMVTNASMQNARSQIAVEQAAPQIPTIGQSSLAERRKDDAIINNTQNWQLAVSKTEHGKLTSGEKMIIGKLGHGAH